VGALIAVAVVGVVATAVMEGIAEMIIRWPIPNAMVEFVKSFVDEDLGVAIGIMYWYIVPR
jgi:amino acid transporter